jgi:hypothetical protein
MNPKQHISKQIERIERALLPGGFWQLGRLLAVGCPAGLVATHATSSPAMRDRVFNRGYRKA